MSRKIGLALGAGSARGLSHIGVLKAFDEAGVKPSYIAGTSIGSMMGAAYACGNLEKMEKFMRKIDIKKMMSYCDFTFPRQALMEGDRIMDLIQELIPAKDFRELQIPFSAIACDIHTGEQVIIDSGDLHMAVRASISLPGIFLPVFHDGRWLVDGGLVNPVPVSVVRNQEIDTVIAVDLNSDVLDANGKKKDRLSKKQRKSTSNKNKLEASKSDGMTDAILRDDVKSNWIIDAMGSRYKEMERSVKDKLHKWANDDEKSKPTGPNIFDAIAFSIDIMSVQITKRNFELSPADYTICPAVGHLGLFDYDEAEPTIDDGYKKAKKLIEDLNKDVF
jgi:NTE family protein